MKKVLIVATIDQHIRHFHQPLIRKLVKLGYQVDIASCGTENFEFVNKKYNISFDRSPFSKKNLVAYKQLSKLLKREHYDIIHVNTPVGAALGRLVSKKYRKKNTKIFYTAHGFHFFKGSNLINWILFFPLEWWLSFSTDTLFVMNNEDMLLAQRYFIKTKVVYINGVGVSDKKFIPVGEKEKEKLRAKLSLSSKKKYLVYVAELSERKNQSLLIDAFFEYQNIVEDIELLLIGKGRLYEEYKKKIERLNLNDKIHLLGYQENIAQFYQASDLLVSSSKQEGLPVNIIEGQFCNLPAVVSNCRGNRDLVKNEINGFVFSLQGSDCKKDFIRFVRKIIDNPILAKKMGEYNEANKEKFLEESVLKVIINEYKLYN
ncbi:glycosyltransferase family 4 protein [Enterococcus dispar]|uniref:glycosyltransferase family 4 protein n=1 Tax=Enterococcus dispar TaxID=44009 RepID=UPI0021D450FA|nr:glycosyltransferase family 4 protein [Enterococcus dispar]MCU7357823.1 glycosyltransferase family 4 protein [Enterococcus dispar]